MAPDDRDVDAIRDVLGSAGARPILWAMSGVLIHETGADTAAGTRLVDEAIERYVAWREECEAARAGYESWSGTTGTERVLRFAAFNAALDREECAAGLYAESVRRLSRFLRPTPRLE